MAVIVILFFGSIVVLPLELLIICLSIGVLWTGVGVFYFKSLQAEEVSRVVPLFSLAPIFVLIVATFLFGEVFNLLTYVGIISLIIGSVLISLRKEGKINISKAFWIMILAAIGWAIIMLMIKYVVLYGDVLSIFFWIMIGMALTSPFLLYFKYNDIKNAVKKHSLVAGYVALSKSLDISAKFLTVAAIAVGTVSLASVLSETQPLFVFLIALIFSIWRPQLLKEELSHGVMLLKIIAIILIFIGAVLIILS
ncbi:MAG: EamA family transporter [Candidatus Aenigmatarchaeota archaeon]